MVTKTSEMLKSIKKQVQKVAPIGTEIILPNHSGVTNHPEIKEEWNYLQGQNQEVKTSSSPTFLGITMSGITLTAVEWAVLDGINQPLATTSSPTFRNLTIGLSEAATDYTLTFDGETNNGIITWMEDEDYFKFSDDIYLNAGESLLYNTTATTGYAANIKLQATDLRGLDIEGTTNDLTDTTTAGRTISATRDVNFGTSAIINSIGLLTTLSMKNTAATIGASNRQWVSIWGQYANTGSVVQDTITARTLFNDPIYFQADDTGTWNSTSTGTLAISNRGMRILQSFTPTLTNTGGASKTDNYYAYGSQINLTNNPTVSSGTWNVWTYGIQVNITGGAGGTSNAYAFHVGGISGADNNYGFYNDTTASNLLGRDNSVSWVGTGKDSGFSYDGIDTIWRPDIVGTGRIIIDTGTAIGQEAVMIQQDDADQAFMNYQGTSEAGATKNISSWTTATIAGYIKVEINGVAYWIPYYNAPTS